MKVYLTDYEEKGLIKPTLVSDLDNYIIYKKYHNHNNENEEVISKYKLRVWLDENVTGENWTKDTKIQYSFKIGVESAENKTYKVIFNSNTDKEEVKEQYIGYNESLALEKNTFTKEGYRFIGWSTTKDGEVKYQDREKVINISGEEDSITLYAVWETGIFNVNVVVQNGIIDDSSTKQVKYEEDILFRLEPNSSLAPGVVSCTNNQIGKLINKELTVLNVTKDTVCTVTYSKDTTVLYNDGTLIINELARDRENNIEKHGTVTKEYEAMSNSNSYVMTSASSQPWVNERTSIKNVELGQEISPVSTAHWFRELRNMETGDFTKLDTSEVTDMQRMFQNSGYNPSIYNLMGLENWNVSKVENMNRMFTYAGYKVDNFKLNLSKWNVSNVTNMMAMFNCGGINATEWSVGDLSSWDVSSVTDMSFMFYSSGSDATEWSIGDLSKWNVSKVTDMNSMFALVARYTAIFDIGDLSNWDVSQVTNMERMFQETAIHAGTFKSIGRLNIPSGCIVNNFAYLTDVAGSRKFTGNLVINGSLSSYTDMLRDTATDSSARINLYYKNTESEAIVDELISLYGPNGTVSKGNIYKVDE